MAGVLVVVSIVLAVGVVAFLVADMDQWWRY